eukprot:5025641-Prymnesium_polylepis.1
MLPPGTMPLRVSRRDDNVAEPTSPKQPPNQPPKYHWAAPLGITSSCLTAQMDDLDVLPAMAKGTRKMLMVPTVPKLFGTASGEQRAGQQGRSSGAGDERRKRKSEDEKRYATARLKRASSKLAASIRREAETLAKFSAKLGTAYNDGDYFEEAEALSRFRAAKVEWEESTGELAALEVEAAEAAYTQASTVSDAEAQRKALNT